MKKKYQQFIDKAQEDFADKAEHIDNLRDAYLQAQEDFEAAAMELEILQSKLARFERGELEAMTEDEYMASDARIRFLRLKKKQGELLARRKKNAWTFAAKQRSNHARVALDNLRFMILDDQQQELTDIVEPLRILI